MGEPSDESDNWSIEGHFEHGRFPTSSFEWTESDPSDWFKQPFLECESRILSESDSARPASHGQSQEEDEKGGYPAQMQRLLFNGRNLVDEKRLIQYNILNGSELICNLKF